MGLKGAKGEGRMKVKKGKTAGKICPSESSCLQIYVVLYHYTSTTGDGETRAMRRLWVYVCVFICIPASHHTFVLHPHAAHVSSKAN